MNKIDLELYENGLVDPKHIKMFLEYKTTSNSHVYNKSYKLVLEKKGKISCSRCPYHSGENHKWKTKDRSWKNYRKTQYKVKNLNLFIETNLLKGKSEK